MLAKTTKLWIHGLVAAVVSGGAGGVTSGTVASMVAPESFNLHAGLGKTIALMIGTFLIQAFMGAMLYLKQSPLPPDDPTSKAQ